MHILYFHQYFNTPRAAGGTRSYEMARALISRGHRVTMVCIQSGRGGMRLNGHPGDSCRRGEIDGIQVIQFNIHYSNYYGLLRRAWVFFKFALRSIFLALRLDYDLVFATSTPLTAGIPGILAHYLRRKPFVFEVRDLWPELPRAMGVVKNPIVLACLSALEWLSYRASSACIALSPGIHEGIARRSRDSQRIAMIPNGCDLDLFVPGRREDLRLPGIGGSEFVAVFTGAHGVANGLDALLDTARVLLVRKREDIVIALIGDGKLKPRLMERARREGLRNCLFFEPLSKNELSRIVSCCSAGLMILDDVPAFYFGTSPNKFFDYISSGLPVINNYPGWLAELIREHHCGEAVPPRDPEALADALCLFADDPQLCGMYGRNARHLAKERFSRADLSGRFVDLLEAVIKESPEVDRQHRTSREPPGS